MAKVFPYDEELALKAQAAMSIFKSPDALDFLFFSFLFFLALDACISAAGSPSLDNGMQQILSALSAAKDPSLDSSPDSPESIKLWELAQHANRQVWIVWSVEWKPRRKLQFQNQFQNLHSLSINPLTL